MRVVQYPSGARVRVFAAIVLVATGLLGVPSPSRAEGATPAASVPYVPEADLNQLRERVIADGSSTVYPIVAEAADRFMAMAPVPIDVEFSGTGGGFRRFCAGESDIQNASRPITEEERAACEAAGVRFAAFTIAFDGITVVVHPTNTWAECLTVAQLHAIWEPGYPEFTWQEVDSAWPDAKIELYGPGPDSGTFDFFTGAIMGEEGVTRTDYQPSENDLDLVEGVASQTNALGYFGFAYYAEDADRLRAVAIDDGAGCVLPTTETIADGTYTPLSRPLFVYVSLESLAKPEVREFLRFTIDQSADIVATVGYVPLPAADYAANRDQLAEVLAAIPAS
jgi:phosphate transport system substrate-binding protein